MQKQMTYFFFAAAAFLVSHISRRVKKKTIFRPRWMVENWLNVEEKCHQREQMAAWWWCVIVYINFQLVTKVILMVSFYA